MSTLMMKSKLAAAGIAARSGRHTRRRPRQQPRRGARECSRVYGEPADPAEGKHRIPKGERQRAVSVAAGTARAAGRGSARFARWPVRPSSSQLRARRSARRRSPLRATLTSPERRRAEGPIDHPRLPRHSPDDQRQAHRLRTVLDRRAKVAQTTTLRAARERPAPSPAFGGASTVRATAAAARHVTARPGSLVRATAAASGASPVARAPRVLLFDHSDRPTNVAITGPLAAVGTPGQRGRSTIRQLGTRSSPRAGVRPYQPSAEQQPSLRPVNRARSRPHNSRRLTTTCPVGPSISPC